MRATGLLGLLALLLGACAHTPTGASSGDVTVVVLPASADGHVGAVVVRPLRGEPVVLDQAYMTADVAPRSPAQITSLDRRRVGEAFGPALAAMPRRAVGFTVYFVEGTDELNPEARRILDRVSVEIGSRPAPEVSVIGHTDALGTDDYNDRLSVQRAQRVRDLLVARGIPREIITVSGRGKREPLYPHPEDVAEPRNRRVEISIR